MTNPSTLSAGNIKGQWILAITISPSSVAPNTTAEQTFVLTNCVLGDMIDISKPTTQGGLGIVNSRVSANGVIAIAFGNLTTGTITPTSNEVYFVQISRPENVTQAGASPLSFIPS